MDAQHEVEVKGGAKGDMLVLGKASWSKTGNEDTSLKYAWEDKKGRRARGGELPIWALPQGVLFAAEHGYMSRKQMAQIAKGLVDRLAKG
ncbi:MAG TPA: hypothetical protein VMB05_03410 [Solirubrobacteraceae bacterium]|nr:hypothetical protein [Solirubrobacteraceae bacterium]